MQEMSCTDLTVKIISGYPLCEIINLDAAGAEWWQ